MTNLDLQVLPELQNFLPPDPSTDEALEKQLLATKGPVAPLVAWRKENGELILVDGHRRLTACQRLGLPYAIKEITLASLQAAKQWMWDHQNARRNWTVLQRDAAMEAMRRACGGDTVEAAKKTGVHPRTQFRAQAAAKNKDRLTPSVRAKVDAGKLDISRKDLQALADLPAPEQERVATAIEDRKAHSIKEALKAAKQKVDAYREAFLRLHPDIQAKINDKRLAATKRDVIHLAELPRSDQWRAVEEFLAGEFTSLWAALEGERGPDDPADLVVGDTVPAEPVVLSAAPPVSMGARKKLDRRSFDKAVKQIAQVSRTIDEIGSSRPGREYARIMDLLRQVGGMIEAWEAIVVQQD